MSIRFVSLVAIGLALAPLAGADEARLVSLGNPTVSPSLSNAPLVEGELLMPGDRSGLGISAIRDPIDVWRFPNRIAGLVGSTGARPSALYDGPSSVSVGAIIPFGVAPVGLGVFCFQPEYTGWVAGHTRGAMPPFAESFAQEITNAAVTEAKHPVPPTHVVDLLIGAELGIFSVGLGGGYSYEITEWYYDDDQEGSSHETIRDSRTQMVSGRLGLGLDLPAVTVDLGGSLYLGSYLLAYQSGSNALPLADIDASVVADNIAWLVGARAIIPLGQDLDLSVVGEYRNMDQDFSATNDAGDPVDSETVYDDPVNFRTISAGVGLERRVSTRVTVTALVSAAFGGATGSEEVLAVPSDSDVKERGFNWKHIRALSGAEIVLARRFTARGGIGAGYVDVGAWGESDKDIRPSGALGLGIQPSQKITVDCGIRLDELLAGGTPGPELLTVTVTGRL